MSTYHEPAQTEKTNLLPVEALRHWRPGQPIPKDFDPDPWAALARNAAAHEMEEQRRRFNDRRQPRPADRRAA